MTKKAQVTVFVVIGLVILIAASFFTYYRTLTLKEAEIVPEDVRPIKNYVQSCLEQVSKEAIIKLGMQGGYIEIPDEIRLNNAFVEIIPRSRIMIPYWSYNNLNVIPSIGNMENQISTYIRENIQDCMDFSIFLYDFEIEEKDEIQIKTTIAEKDVDIMMVHELLVKDKLNGDLTKISKFNAELPVKLKQVYELGKKIMDAENIYTYFENMTINWISMNRDIPLNGLEFHCSDLRWNVEEVKEELKDMIYYNLPKVKIQNTNYPKFLEDEKIYKELKKYDLEDIHEGKRPKVDTPQDAYDYSHYLLDVRTSKTDLKTGFSYQPSWGMDMIVRPSENGVMKTNKQNGNEEFLSFICLNVYHFTYDITYPIEVMVRDDESFNDKGYVFRFAFPVMINHNAPDRDGFFNSEFIMIGGETTGQCDGLSGPEYDIRAFGVDDFGITNMELKNVNLSYDCYKFRCDLGKTKADQGAYKLVTQLPSSCANGFVIAEKKGYLTSKQQVLDDEEIDVELKKLKEFEFEIMMNTYNVETNRIQGQIPVKEPFRAIIDIQSIDEPSLSYFGRYPFDQRSQDKMIKLIEQNSKYKLEITLYDEQEGRLIGGYKGEWNLRYNNIVNGKKIIFKTAKFSPTPMNKQDEADVAKFLEENNIYKDKLKPEII